MPLPKPKEGETQKDFVSRCISFEADASPDREREQVVAMCHQAWRDRSKNVKAKPSLQQRENTVRQAFYEAFPGQEVVETASFSGYIVETFDDHVVVSVGVEYWSVPYKKKGNKITFAPRDEWQKVKEQKEWVPAKNALKAVSRTDDELRVANYIVLFGGRDLEGIASDRKNADGSLGEYFTAETVLESNYTKSGVLHVDWEHGEVELDADEVLGVVDWKTAKPDTRGVWVERILKRSNQYVKWLEELIDAGIVGTSSSAVPSKIKKADDGQITRWPLRRDTLTVTPMEPRMITENHIQAFKALGIPVPEDKPEPKATPEADLSAVVAGKARVRLSQLETSFVELKE